MQTFTAVKNTQHIMILITNVNVEFGCIHRYRLFESIESKYVCKFDIYIVYEIHSGRKPCFSLPLEFAIEERMSFFTNYISLNNPLYRNDL